MTALPPTYEPVMNALLALLRAQLQPGVFRTVQRRMVTWQQLVTDIQSGVIPFPQPALILYDGVGLGGGTTRYEQRQRTLTVRVLSRTLIVYAQLPGGNTPSGIDHDTPGGSVFAPLVEAIEGVFQTRDQQGAALTLGGLVSHAWIEGESMWITGDIDPSGQGMLTIPINIMMAY